MMTLKRAAAVWLSLLLGPVACAGKSVPKASSSTTEPALPTPADLESKIQLSIEIGRGLYIQDRASSVGTDVLFASVPKEERTGMGGFLTVGDADESGQPLPSATVLFFTADDPPLVRYRVRVPLDRARKPSLQRVIPPEPAQGPLLDLIRARTAALKAAGPFQQPINPAVLPAGGLGEDGDILVELLAGTTKDDTVVLGKHFRVLVSADGRQVKSVTALSRGPLEVTRPRLAKGASVVSLAVTQIVTDYPVETHVFASMFSGLPIYVETSRGTWLVDGDTIRLVSAP